MMLAPTVSLQVNSVALSHISFSPNGNTSICLDREKQPNVGNLPVGRPANQNVCFRTCMDSWSTGRLLHTTMQITQIPGHTRRRIRNRSHRTSSLVLGTSATNLPRIWSKLRRRRHTQALIRFRTQGDVSRVMCGSSA